MRRGNLARRRGGLALLLCCVLLAGCGSSSSQSTSSATTTQSPESQSSEPTAPTTIEGSDLGKLPQAPEPTGRSPVPSPHGTTVDEAFLRAAFNDAQQLWHKQFTAAGLPYAPARLVIYSSAVHSACGAQENVGPFYCGADRTIYLDVPFFDLLARQAGVGAFAQAYVIGHEFGHHVQHLLGIDQRTAAANHVDPSGENARSVRVELQADCFSGVWAHSAYTRGQLTPTDLEEALKTAALIGDDFQAKAAGRPVDPGLFTHGSSAQRQHWLVTGFNSGRPASCDTISHP